MVVKHGQPLILQKVNLGLLRIKFREKYVAQYDKEKRMWRRNVNQELQE